MIGWNTERKGLLSHHFNVPYQLFYLYLTLLSVYTKTEDNQFRLLIGCFEKLQVIGQGFVLHK